MTDTKQSPIPPAYVPSRCFSCHKLIYYNPDTVQWLDSTNHTYFCVRGRDHQGRHRPMSEEEKKFFDGFEPKTIRVDPIGPTAELRAKITALEAQLAEEKDEWRIACKTVDRIQADLAEERNRSRVLESGLKQVRIQLLNGCIANDLWTKVSAKIDASLKAKRMPMKATNRVPSGERSLLEAANQTLREERDELQQQVTRITAALRAAHPFASEEMLNEIVAKVAALPEREENL